MLKSIIYCDMDLDWESLNFEYAWTESQLTQLSF